MPYGDTQDGSVRRAKYVKDLEAYLGSALQPILEAWEGELPAHLQKVCTSDASTLAPHVLLARGFKFHTCGDCLWERVSAVFESSPSTAYLSLTGSADSLDDCHLGVPVHGPVPSRGWGTAKSKQ